MTTTTTEGDERCVCCDLPLYSCGTGLAQAQILEAKARRQRALSMPGVVPAKHAAKCRTCRSPVSVGDPIRKTEDGWSGVLCCQTVVGEE